MQLQDPHPPLGFSTTVHLYGYLQKPKGHVDRYTIFSFNYQTISSWITLLSSEVTPFKCQNFFRIETSLLLCSFRFRKWSFNFKIREELKGSQETAFKTTIHQFQDLFTAFVNGIFFPLKKEMYFYSFSNVPKMVILYLIY